MSLYRRFKDGTVQRWEKGEFVDCPADEPWTRVRPPTEGMIIAPAEAIVKMNATTGEFVTRVGAGRTFYREPPLTSNTFMLTGPSDCSGQVVSMAAVPHSIAPGFLQSRVTNGERYAPSIIGPERTDPGLESLPEPTMIVQAGQRE